MPRHGVLLVLALIGLTACSVLPSVRPSLDGAVVDADAPVFTHPKKITNRLFPAAEVTQLVQLGVDGGQPLRVEMTRMPETRVIEWEGQPVETVVVQFIAYRNRRVIEVAYDFFAQADDGSVWYFGETVDNYADGRVINHSGAWLAGEDGPPGMIMPAAPRVGDIYHPENIPGVVFEELIVLETDVVIDGPSGPISGVIRVEEHLMDGGVEQKLWAPGYGEFRAEATNELVTVAVAAPTDARPGPVPDDVVAMHAAAAGLVDAMAAGQDAAPDAALGDIRTSWEAYRSQAPPLLAEEVQGSVGALDQAVGAGDRRAIRQAGVDVLQAVLDLELQYRPAARLDLDRIAAWMQQLMLDADASDRGGVVGDTAIASVIWARTVSSVDALSSQRIGALLQSASDAAGTGETARARTAAREVIRAVASRADD